MNDSQIVTFGCRLNAQESEIMRANALAAGLGDAVIVNTCAVTAEAVRQARQTIRKLWRERPGVRIVVTGCAAQIEPETFAGMPEVDHVIGNAEKLRPDTFRSLAFDDCERVLVNDIFSVRETAGHLVDGYGGKARAYVQVQNGCDHRCTFCIIPFGRGNSRSVPAGEVVAQVSRLVESGYKEIVLTGVDITAYGADLPGTLTLGRLVQTLLDRVSGLRRLRLSSIDSVEADAALLDSLSDPRLMPHLHLSLQAGHDLTLKRMKRRHSRADAARFCAEARERRSDLVLGADLIAGFPTETDEMFEASLSLVDELDLTFLHVFPFSARSGTPAAKMPQLDRRLVKDRAGRLREKGATALARRLALEGSRVAEVLMERETLGRTEHYIRVRLDRPAPPGEVRGVRITGNDGLTLFGTPA